MNLSERPMLHRSGRGLLCVAFLFASASYGIGQDVLSLSSKLPKANQTANTPLEDIRKAFRTSYNEAIDSHSKKIISNYPVITQDLLNMTLIRSNGNKIRYSMDKLMYFLMANTSHPPLTIYSILSRNGFGTLLPETVQSLEVYLDKLSRAALEVRDMPLDQKVKRRILNVLNLSRKYIETISSNKKTSIGQFRAYVAPLRKSINSNLYVGAHEQLVQFKRQVDKWRQEFPEENWKELRVVIIGFHQPREEYALKLFFQWLLREPKYEKSVVYAEFQTSISGAERENAERFALLQLTKVDFDLEASSLIFGAPHILQRDVMGPSSVKILRHWGKSRWPGRR